MWYVLNLVNIQVKNINNIFFHCTTCLSDLCCVKYPIGTIATFERYHYHWWHTLNYQRENTWKFTFSVRRYYFHTNFDKIVALCNVRYDICGSPGIAHQRDNKWPDNFEKSNQNTLVSSLHMSQKIIMQNKNISWENSFAKIVQKWSILTPISVVFKHLSFTR